MKRRKKMKSKKASKNASEDCDSKPMSYPPTIKIPHIHSLSAFPPLKIYRRKKLAVNHDAALRMNFIQTRG